LADVLRTAVAIAQVGNAQSTHAVFGMKYMLSISRFGHEGKLLAALVVVALAAQSLWANPEWPATGQYSFTDWSGPPLAVYYSIPTDAGPRTPIVIVVPGAKRNARQYRDEWDQLAKSNQFITLVLAARKRDFPTEWVYNLGGANGGSDGSLPVAEQLISAIDPLFDDFRERFGSTRETYSLYGHSAGGGFVHLFLLTAPNAKVDRAVAANPAFFTMPDGDVDFPFGLHGLAVPQNGVRHWFARPLVIMLGDHDLDPRAQPLSNSAEAQLQGPHVFARGLGFYRQALCAAKSRGIPLEWRLEIVPGVGHSNERMAPHAVKYLIGE
jgi:poly(3-hydroxybutyrate) depolymerase